jgi:PadR family transcriptional regulator, regulatory protein PadR
MADTKKANALLPGTLDLLILRTLALEAMHGFGISARLTQISRGVFQVNPGSLFPAFRRLERDGLIKGDWQDTENNRRAKYYSLTSRGRSALKAETDSWETQVQAIGRFLKASPEDR